MPESKRLMPASKAGSRAGVSPGGSAASGSSSDGEGSAGSEESDAVADWGKAQVYHSANWGGTWANYLTGGLSLQIEVREVGSGQCCVPGLA